MTQQLYEFLKDKGEEFCYSGDQPCLVNPYVKVEYMEEYAELINSSDENEQMPYWLFNVVDMNGGGS